MNKNKCSLTPVKVDGKQMMQVSSFEYEIYN